MTIWKMIPYYAGPKTRKNFGAGRIAPRRARHSPADNFSDNTHADSAVEPGQALACSRFAQKNPMENRSAAESLRKTNRSRLPNCKLRSVALVFSALRQVYSAQPQLTAQFAGVSDPCKQARAAARSHSSAAW